MPFERMLVFEGSGRLVLVQGDAQDPEFAIYGVHSPRQYSHVWALGFRAFCAGFADP